MDTTRTRTTNLDDRLRDLRGKVEETDETLVQLKAGLEQGLQAIGELTKNQTAVRQGLVDLHTAFEPLGMQVTSDIANRDFGELYNFIAAYLIGDSPDYGTALMKLLPNEPDENSLQLLKGRLGNICVQASVSEYQSGSGGFMCEAVDHNKMLMSQLSDQFSDSELLQSTLKKIGELRLPEQTALTPAPVVSSSSPTIGANQQPSRKRWVGGDFQRM